MTDPNPDDVLLFSSKDAYKFAFIVIPLALFGGCGMGVGMMNDHWRTEIVNHGAAHYDTKTAAWTWNSEGASK